MMPTLFILIGGSLWGIIGLFSTRLSAAGCSPVEITFIRNLVGAVGMIAYLGLTCRDKLKISIKDLWMFLGTGILSIVFFNIMYFWTINLATLSVAAILLYTAPCFVMIMSALFFGEKMTGKKITALIMAFLGCAFTTGVIDTFVLGSGPGAGTIKSLGIATGIASGFGYALYSIFGNAALKKYSSETVTVYTFVIAALSLAPFALRPSFFSMTGKGPVLTNAVAIGLVCTMLPFLFYTAGLKNTPPGKASVMAFVEPMVATLVSVFVMHEPFTITGMIGICMIFSSIVILALAKESGNDSGA